MLESFFKFHTSKDRKGSQHIEEGLDEYYYIQDIKTQIRNGKAKKNSKEF